LVGKSFACRSVRRKGKRLCPFAANFLAVIAMLLQRLRQVLQRVQSGELSVEEALQQLRALPFEELGFAKIDHHRLLRRGFPEAVYCLHKTPEQVQKIVAAMAQTGVTVLATKASPAHFEAVTKYFGRTFGIKASRMPSMKAW